MTLWTTMWAINLLIVPVCSPLKGHCGIANTLGPVGRQPTSESPSCSLHGKCPSSQTGNARRPHQRWSLWPRQRRELALALKPKPPANFQGLEVQSCSYEH